MASIASFSVTPKVAQAATGENVRPVILPIIEICAAGALWMFQSRFAETSRHGGGGQFHAFSMRVMRRCFSLISPSLPVSTVPCTVSDSISRISSRNARNSGECPAQ